VNLQYSETGRGKILVDGVEVPHVTGVDIRIRVGEVSTTTIHTVGMKTCAEVSGEVEILERCPRCNQVTPVPVLP